MIIAVHCKLSRQRVAGMQAEAGVEAALRDFGLHICIFLLRVIMVI